MKIKEQFSASWTFAVAAGIFILLTVLSTTGIYDVSNILFGLVKILLAVTITYTCIKVSKSFRRKANTPPPHGSHTEQGSFPDYGFMMPFNTYFKATHKIYRMCLLVR